MTDDEIIAAIPAKRRLEAARMLDAMSPADLVVVRKGRGVGGTETVARLARMLLSEGSPQSSGSDQGASGFRYSAEIGPDRHTLIVDGMPRQAACLFGRPIGALIRRWASADPSGTGDPDPCLRSIAIAALIAERERAELRDPPTEVRVSRPGPLLPSSIVVRHGSRFCVQEEPDPRIEALLRGIAPTIAVTDLNGLGSIMIGPQVDVVARPGRDAVEHMRALAAAAALLEQRP